MSHIRQVTASTARAGSIAAICAAAATALSYATYAAGELSPAQEAIERSEILNLMGWSVVAFDSRDMRRFLSAFAQGSSFNVKDMDASRNVSMDKAQMAKVWLSNSPPVPAHPGHDTAAMATQHFTSNLSVTFSDASHAKLHGYEMMVQMPAGVKEGPLVPAAMGWYDIALVKSQGKWLFANYTLIHAGAEKPSLD